MFTIEFQFELGDTVTVDGKVEAIVTSCQKGLSGGISYYVEWFDHTNKRYGSWFEESRVTA